MSVCFFQELVFILSLSMTVSGAKALLGYLLSSSVSPLIKSPVSLRHCIYFSLSINSPSLLLGMLLHRAHCSFPKSGFHLAMRHPSPWEVQCQWPCMEKDSELSSMSSAATELHGCGVASATKAMWPAATMGNHPILLLIPILVLAKGRLYWKKTWSVEVKRILPFCWRLS